jgi:crotonobetainyl-CoA:carnitine CoA-transferase CaiB-like acyl-CoA transferase
LSATPPDVRRRAPLLGEHTTGVLSEMGFADWEIEKLVKRFDGTARLLTRIC